MQKALLIFVKNPALGKVKTRLAKTVGPYNALKIYQHLLDHTLEITYEMNTVERFVYYNDFIPTKDEWPTSVYGKELQKGADLGEKMSNAFKKSFSEGFSKVVLIMPDCPKMTDTLLEKAYKTLDTHDFVLGPTHDGGFYLIGMKELEASIFLNRQYSNDAVLSGTIAEIEKLGKTWFKLPPLVDVDTEEDLGNLRRLIKPEGQKEAIPVVDPELILQTEVKPDEVDELVSDDDEDVPLRDDDGEDSDDDEDDEEEEMASEVSDDEEDED